MTTSRSNARELTADQMCRLLERAGIHQAKSAAVAAAVASPAASNPTYTRTTDDEIIVGGYHLKKTGAGTAKRWVVQSLRSSKMHIWDFLSPNKNPSPFSHSEGELHESQQYCQSNAECGYAALVMLLNLNTFENIQQNNILPNSASSLFDDLNAYNQAIGEVINSVNAAILAAPTHTTAAAATTQSMQSPSSAAIAKPVAKSAPAAGINPPLMPQSKPGAEQSAAAKGILAAREASAGQPTPAHTAASSSNSAAPTSSKLTTGKRQSATQIAAAAAAAAAQTQTAAAAAAAAPTTTPSKSTPRDLTDDDLAQLIIETGIAESKSDAADYILAFNMMQDSVFKDKVQKQIGERKDDKDDILSFLVNTSMDASDSGDRGESAHWLVVDLTVNEQGKVTEVTVYDSNATVSTQTQTLYKQKILEGLDDLKDSADILVEFNSTDIKQSHKNSCGYCALALFVSNFDNQNGNLFHQTLINNNDQAYEIIEPNATVRQENDIISACNQILDRLRATATNIAPPAASSTAAVAAANVAATNAAAASSTAAALQPNSSSPAYDSPAVSDISEKIRNHLNSTYPGLNDPDQKKLKNAINEILSKMNEKKHEAFSRTLIASINRYAELKFSAHKNDGELRELEERINSLHTTLLEDKEVLKQLNTEHVNKIADPKQRNKYSTDIEKRMSLPLVENALNCAERLESTKLIVDGWLQATILERSKAKPCNDQDKARQEVNQILGSNASTPNIIPGLTNGGDDRQSISKDNIDKERAEISVFDMSITMKNQSIKAATVRTVDPITDTVKSEFHFNQADLEKFKGRKNTDAEMMKMVSQNVLNQFMPMKAANKPIQLNIGSPPILPKSMIEAYIIYCDFKGINLDPPVGYRQFQEDLKKPGWFGRDSTHDAFAKAWKISNPRDLGREERKNLENTYPPTSPTESSAERPTSRPRR